MVLRTKKPLFERERIFKGRAGVRQTTRPYHLYVLRPEGKDSIVIDELEFVKYSEEYLDARGGGKYSKARAILDFLRENRDRAFFSKEIAEALRDRGVKVRDVMANVRRFERKGLVYVRGYKTDERQTPFKEGYLITWLDPNKPRQQAIREAIRRTDKVLADRASANPFMESIHRISGHVIKLLCLFCLTSLVSVPFPVEDEKVKLLLNTILSDERRHHELLKHVLETIVRRETITEEDWWKLIWENVPFHGTPGG